MSQTTSESKKELGDVSESPANAERPHFTRTSRVLSESDTERRRRDLEEIVRLADKAATPEGLDMFEEIERWAREHPDEAREAQESCVPTRKELDGKAWLESETHKMVEEHLAMMESFTDEECEVLEKLEGQRTLLAIHMELEKLDEEDK